MILFRFVLIELIDENSRCYKFGILVAITGPEGEISSDYDQKNINASYKKGVLKLIFKKTKETEGKIIEIKTS